MLDVESRRVAERNRLAGQREGTGDERLRRDDGRRRGQRHHRQQCPGGRHHEERLLGCVRMHEQQGALPEVVQKQRRQDEREPCQPDRLRTEVPHVGVERFTAGDHEENGAKDREAVQAVVTKKVTA